MGDEPADVGGDLPFDSAELRDALERLFRSGLVNAVLSWGLVVVLAFVFVESALDIDRLWTSFVGTAGVIVLVPPVAHRDWRVMLPWELLVLALLPILVRGLFGGDVGTFAAHLAIAGLALVLTVELHTFTALEVNRWFAVAFVVLTTMASGAAWSILRWYMDRFFGTSYLTSNEALMAEFLQVALAGIAAGILFESYFRWRDRRLRRRIRQVIRG